MNKSKGMSALFILLLVGVFVFSGFFIWRNYSNDVSNLEQPESISAIGLSNEDWKSYTNSAIGFQINYPKDYKDAYVNLGVQGWEFEPTWGTVNFHKELNKNFVTLIFFPFSGDLDDLLVARQATQVEGYMYQDHPIIPHAFFGTLRLIETLAVDGHTARWYKEELYNQDRQDYVYDVNEVHFVGNGYGFIMRNDNTYFNRESFISMLSSFKFIK